MNNLRDLLEQSTIKYGTKPALGFVDEEFYSYNEVLSWSRGVTAFLQEKGIKKGDKVALLSDNQPNWGICYFGIVMMGAVVVPVLPDFHDDEIENILKHSEVRGVMVSASLLRKIKPSLSDQLQFLLQVDDLVETAFVESGSQQAGSKVEYGKEPQLENTIEKDDIASIIYTSGTTGKSKGVMLSHWNLVFDVMKCAGIHKIIDSDRLLSMLPLSHTYENTLALLLPLYSGASVHYLKKLPTPAVLLPALKKVRPTVMLSVPLIIEKIYKGKILPNINSKALTRVLYKFAPTRKLLNKVAGKKLMETFGGELVFFGVGGAKLDPQVERFLIEAKFPYAVGYGLTETAPLIAGFDSWKGKFQSTGPAVDGIEVIINDPDPQTGEGEIWVRGDNVMKGYFKEPDLTSEVLTPEGWFRTGDLGYIDEDNYLFIRGRLKNMILGASGENIYPEEIEAVINRFKHVLESVVVQKKGKLVAMVHFNHEELSDKYNHLKDQAGEYIDKRVEELSLELKQFVNEKVNKFSRVQVVVAHPEPFEKTATKKIKRFLYY